jgi:hypothetical protein
MMCGQLRGAFAGRLMGVSMLRRLTGPDILKVFIKVWGVSRCLLWELFVDGGGVPWCGSYFLTEWGPEKVNFAEIDNFGKGESMVKTAEPEETFY